MAERGDGIPVAGVVATEPVATTYIVRTEHPQIHLSWGSRMPAKPDKLKIRKRIDVWPLKVVLKADYDTATREFDYGCSVRDKLLHGRFSLNMPHQRIEYHKRFPLPNSSFLSLSGTCALPGPNTPLRSIKPNFNVQLEFGGDFSSVSYDDGDNPSSAVWVGNSFDVRKRVGLIGGVGVEVCGNLALPQPTAHFSPMASSGGGGSLSVGQGAFKVHIAELNFVLNV